MPDQTLKAEVQITITEAELQKAADALQEEVIKRAPEIADQIAQQAWERLKDRLNPFGGDDE